MILFCNIIVVHQVTLELQPFSKIKEAQALLRPMATTKVNLCFLKRDSREQFHIAAPWGNFTEKVQIIEMNFSFIVPKTSL